MKLTQITLALTALLSTAAAQGLADLPTCAASCATGALPKKCGLDPTCICKSTSFLNDMACCVAGKCTPKEQEATLKAAKGICAPAGVTDLPNTLSCSTAEATTSTASQTTLSGSETATATDTNTEATTTATGAGGSSATATAASSASSMASSASSAATSATSAAATTGAAVLGQTKDSSLMAAAGAAAAFAILL